MSFCTARPVTGQQFFDRQQTLGVLLRAVEGLGGGAAPRWFSLFGMRKAGKTSLLRELSRQICTDVLCATVDCWQFRSNPSDLFFQLGAAVVDSYLMLTGLSRSVPPAGSARTAAALAECVGAGRGRVEPAVLEGLEMLREVLRGESSSRLWEGLADLPQSVARSIGTPAVVAFDEFQELERLGRPARRGPSGSEIYAVLRARWQTHDRVMYVVAGSRMTALRELLFDKDAPFFQHFTPLELGPFERDDARSLLRTHLSGLGARVTDEVIDAIIAAVGTLPFYLQVVGAELVDASGGGEQDLAAVRRAVDRCVLQGGVLGLFFRNLFERVVGRSGMLARTLVALADPAPLGALAERIGVASGAAGTFVKRLMNEDLVVKDAKGRYFVADPCFRLWLLSQEDLGNVSSPSLIGDVSERRVTEELAALGFRVIYQSRASRGAFDLLALLWGHEFAIQVRTGDPPLRLPAAQVRRMQHEARELGWIPLLATAGRVVSFFDLAAVDLRRRRTVAFGTQVEPVDDVLSLVRRGGGST